MQIIVQRAKKRKKLTVGGRVGVGEAASNRSRNASVAVHRELAVVERHGDVGPAFAASGRASNANAKVK